MQKIFITGVSRGLGRALAEFYIAAGHRVFGCARSEPAIAELRTVYPEHHFSAVDIALDDDVARWSADVLGNHGAPDLLINNAGLMCRTVPLWEHSDEEFTRLLDANIRGVANIIRHVVPAMVKERSGIIVNFSSGRGRTVAAGVAPYCATKWAIEGLTRALAEELPEGMAAVTLNPGIIDTSMLRSRWGERANIKPLPSGRKPPRHLFCKSVPKTTASRSPRLDFRMRFNAEKMLSCPRKVRT